MHDAIMPSSSITSVVLTWLVIVGRVEILQNDQGNRITPSVVAFTKEGRLVGEAAKNQVTRHRGETEGAGRALRVGHSSNECVCSVDCDEMLWLPSVLRPHTHASPHTLASPPRLPSILPTLCTMPSV